MSTITDSYKDEMTEAIAALDLEDIEFEHTRYREYDDIEARNKLIVRFLPIPFSIIGKLGIKQWFVDDCLQAGNEALFKAIDAWDSDKTSSLAAWCYMYARRDMLREVERIKGQDDWVDIEEIVEESDREPENEETTQDSQVHDIPILSYDCQGMSQATLKWLWQQVDKEDWTTRNLLQLVLRNGHSVQEAGWILGMSQSAADRLYQNVICKLRVTSLI